MRKRNDRILSPHTLCGLQLTQLRARFVLSTCRRFFRFWFVFCQSQLMEIKISKSNFIPVESDVIFNPVKDMVSILLCMVYVLSDSGTNSRSTFHTYIYIHTSYIRSPFWCTNSNFNALFTKPHPYHPILKWSPSTSPLTNMPAHPLTYLSTHTNRASSVIYPRPPFYTTCGFGTKRSPAHHHASECHCFDWGYAWEWQLWMCFVHVQDKIYTSIGNILISVNPFKQLPLHGPKVFVVVVVVVVVFFTFVILFHAPRLSFSTLMERRMSHTCMRSPKPRITVWRMRKKHSQSSFRAKAGLAKQSVWRWAAVMTWLKKFPSFDWLIGWGLG